MTREPDPWQIEGLPSYAAEAYGDVEWGRGACRDTWLPPQAWNPNSWGHHPRYSESAPRAILLAAATRWGVPPVSDPLVLSGLLHLAEIGGDASLVGRRSPLVKLALRTCGTCPIREDCYEYAVAVPAEIGIWGGTNERQRRDERARRRRQRHQRS